MTTLTEANVEAAPLEWLRDLGWPDAPGLEGDLPADPGQRRDPQRAGCRHRLRRTRRQRPLVTRVTVTERDHTRRPDIVLFVNGLPLRVIEIKNPADGEADIWTAWQQLQTYQGRAAPRCSR